MIFVDTGFFLALLNRRDQLHARAVRWQTAVTEPLLTTEFILCETVNGMSSLADRAKVHDAVDEIRSSPEWEVVAATAGLFDAGLALHRQHTDKEWSLTDCISFAVMLDRRVQRAFAHDHHFEQAGFEALLRRDPP